MFHSQKQSAIVHSYCEKIQFLKQKIIFFSIKSSYFIKKWAFLTNFCQILNFGLLAWSICVPPELFDIGGLEIIIWSPLSSNGLIIRPLLALGGRKNLFFLSGVGGWNNHLQIICTKNFQTPEVKKCTKKWWKNRYFKSLNWLWKTFSESWFQFYTS